MSDSLIITIAVMASFLSSLIAWDKRLSGSRRQRVCGFWLGICFGTLIIAFINHLIPT